MDTKPQASPHLSSQPLSCSQQPRHSQIRAAGRQAKLVMSMLGNYMTGEVRDGHFYVHDAFHNHVSHRGLVGEAPRYQPISLQKIDDAGHTIEYLTCEYLT